MEYSLEKITFNVEKCHARKWDNKGATSALGSTPYLQCNKKIYENNLCKMCFTKQEKEILWTGLITESPPKNPICITKTGNKTNKKWNYNSTNGLKTDDIDNGHKNTIEKEEKNTIEKEEKNIIEKEERLNLDEEFDFDELKRQSKLIKEKLKKSSCDHGGAPFSGLLECDNDDTEFDDYKDLSYNGSRYKINNYNNQVLDISNVVCELDADRIKLVGTWDNERKRII